MARYNSKDYIPTYGDIEARRAEWEKNAKAARDRGFKLGEYELTYTVNGHKFTEKATGASRDAVVEVLKQQCGMVGWNPVSIEVKTLVEPNIYV